jgi:hypothetical protein
MLVLETLNRTLALFFDSRPRKSICHARLKYHGRSELPNPPEPMFLGPVMLFPSDARTVTADVRDAECQVAHSSTAGSLMQTPS